MPDLEKSSRMKFFAKLISYLLHPLFAPLVSVFLLFHLPIYLNYKYTSQFFNYIYGLFFLNLIAIPLLINVYLKYKKIISSIQLHQVSERTIPYFITAFFYLLTYYLLAEINFPSFYLSTFLAAGLTIVGLMLLTFLNYKSSAHLAGLGGICGLLITSAIQFSIDTSNLLIIFILFAGFAGFARLALQAHRPNELVSGFCLGLGLQFISLL